MTRLYLIRDIFTMKNKNGHLNGSIFWFNWEAWSILIQKSHPHYQWKQMNQQVLDFYYLCKNIILHVAYACCLVGAVIKSSVPLFLPSLFPVVLRWYVSPVHTKLLSQPHLSCCWQTKNSHQQPIYKYCKISIVCIKDNVFSIIFWIKSVFILNSSLLKGCHQSSWWKNLFVHTSKSHEILIFYVGYTIPSSQICFIIKC